MTVVHGGNVYEMALNLGCRPDAILDYSASINPLGAPPGLLEEINAGWVMLQHYPDITKRLITKALGQFHSLDPSSVIVGNGSTELIYWLPKALGIQTAVVIQPTFGEYWKAFEIQGVKLDRLVALEKYDFQPTVEQLDEVCGRGAYDCILFTQPGNPSGLLIPKSVREWILNKSIHKGTYCIIDEAFVDFCEEESLKAHLADHPNLIIIRSMTKFYGLPGLRLGYVLTCSEEVASRLRNTLPPWSVNTLAQIAGPFCLNQREYRERTLNLVKSERLRMMNWLELLGCFRVYDGNANYLMVRLHEEFPTAATLQREVFSSERILVRDCSSFEGLGDRHLRVAVRLPEQNDRLLLALERWADQYRGAWSDKNSCEAGQS